MTDHDQADEVHEGPQRHLCAECFLKENTTPEAAEALPQLARKRGTCNRCSAIAECVAVVSCSPPDDDRGAQVIPIHALPDGAPLREDADGLPVAAAERLFAWFANPKPPFPMEAAERLFSWYTKFEDGKRERAESDAKSVESRRFWERSFTAYARTMEPSKAGGAADRALVEWHRRHCEDCDGDVPHVKPPHVAPN